MGKLRRTAIQSAAIPVLACAALVTMLAKPALTEEVPNRSLDIGAFHVDLDSTFLPDPLYLRAFVATGSSSPNCLVTLQEANPNAHLIGPVFCGPRTYEGQRGVLITLFFPGPGGAPEDIYVALTVFHEKARHHANPVPYSGD
jgi:hypothetical protein